MKKKIISGLMAIMLFFTLANSVSAVASGDLWKSGGEGTSDDVGSTMGLGGAESKTPVQVVSNVIKLLLGFLGIFAVILILYAGFKWMTAGGSDENIKVAKKMLSAGVIGLIIILSAYGIAEFVLDKAVGATQ